MGVPELSAFHLRLLMTYLRMETNHEPTAFYPYLSRQQFNNTKRKIEFFSRYGSNNCAVTKLEVMQYAGRVSNMNLVYGLVLLEFSVA